MERLTDLLVSLEPDPLVLGGGLTEGPLWHDEGHVTFVRLRLNQLARWDQDGTYSVVRRDTGGGNGCTLDARGHLIICEQENRRVTRWAPDGSMEVVADRWQGKRLNRPNDVVCRSDGSIYFTDPQVVLQKEDREIGFSPVFRVDPDGEVECVTDACEYPNGLAFSPDERKLYVSITRLDDQCLEEAARGEVCRHRKVRVFSVKDDGRLSSDGVFIDMSSSELGPPDGMKVDTEGRLYCTGSGGIWVMTPEGERIGVIRLPEQARNLAFGGPDRSTMYVTAGDSLYRFATRVRGIAP